MPQKDFEPMKNLLKLEKKPKEQFLLPIEVQYYETDNKSGNENHLREYLQRINRHKWIVIIITLLLTTAAGIYLYRQPEVFQAEARVQIDSQGEGGLDPTKGSSSPFEDRAYFNTQLELLEAPELIRSVIKKLNLEKNQDFLSNNLQAQVAPSNSKSSEISKNSNSGGAKDGAEKPKTNKLLEAERLNPMVEIIIDSLNIQPVLQTRQTVKDTRLISIKFKHPNPKITADISNAVADQLVISNLDKKLRTNSNENDYLQNNIADLKSQIRRDEERLLQYGRNYQLPSMDEKQNTVIERLAGLNQQLLEAENDRKRAEASYNAALAPGAADAISEMNTKPISDVDGKLDDLRQRRAQLLVEVTEKHPDVREIDNQIAVLEAAAKNKREKATSMLKTSLEVKYKEALAREESIRDSFKKQWGETLNQNSAAINYRIIQRGLETNRKLLDEMQQREQENEMLKAKVPNNIHVVNYAVTPTKPLDQKRSQYLGLAFLFSFTLGIGVALLRDYFDNAIHSADEVEKTLSLPAIASIPQISNGIFGYSRKLNSGNSLQLANGDEDGQIAIEAGNELIINGDAQSPLAEAFRQLRTILLLSPEVGKIKKLLVTSSRQGEGKTTTAINIATSLSQTGATALVIDADLRNPRLHKIFNLPNEEGLSDILTNPFESKKVSELLVKQYENLYFLPAGKLLADCADCLSSKQMQELLNSLEKKFDFIVIDSPPVGTFADSAILAAMTDGVLLVVQENRNSAETLRQTRKLLNMVGANIVGVVLNKVKTVNESYDYNYQN